MNASDARWTMQYADPRRFKADTGDYVVVSPDGKTRLQYPDKSSAIGECQRRNGWRVDGKEQTMAEQTRGKMT